jgi:A/G-specific adenine glycosylase
VSETDLKLVAEKKALYRVERYEGSSRYYRGKAVDLLRALGPAEGLTALEIGAGIKPHFGPDDHAWAEKLLAGLCRDSLAVMVDGKARLP